MEAPHDIVAEDDVPMIDADLAVDEEHTEASEQTETDVPISPTTVRFHTPGQEGEVTDSVLQDLYNEFGPELELWNPVFGHVSSRAPAMQVQIPTVALEYPIPSASHDDHAEPEDPVMSNPKSTLIDNPQVEDTPPTCNPAQLKQEAFLCLPYHSYPSLAMQLFQTIRNRSRFGVINVHDVYRLNRTAAFLHALKAYELAFDIYLLILRYHNDANVSATCPSPQLVIAVINCMRCAQTPYQRYLAREAWKPVLQWLQTQDEKILESRTAASRYLRQLDENLGLEPRPSRNHYNDEISHSAVIDMVLGRNTPFDARIWEPRHFIAHWRDFVLEHLSECDITRTCILEALKKFIQYVKTSAQHIDSVLTSRWKATDRAMSVHVARVLAGLLIQDEAGQDSVATPVGIPDSPHSAGGFPCTLNGLAIVVLPFVLTERIRQSLSEVPTTMSGVLQRATRARPSKLLYFAATELQ